MPTDNPTTDDRLAAALTSVRELVQAQNMRAAKQQLRRATATMDDTTWALIVEIAATLRYKTHDAALAKLRNLWYAHEPHRGLIEACVPKPDERQHIPEPAPVIHQRERTWMKPGRITRTVDPSRRTDPSQRTGDRSTHAVDRYESDLDPTARKDPETAYQGVLLGNRDHDRDATRTVSTGLCVSCRLERATLDRTTGQAATGHGDDGLCTECRSLDRPGIPELPLGHTPTDAVHARMEYLTTHYQPRNRSLYHQEYLAAHPTDQPLIAHWIRTYTQPDPPIPPRQLPTTPTVPNAECTECGEWRQLRDDLCVDCHPGLDQLSPTPAGSIELSSSRADPINEESEPDRRPVQKGEHNRSITASAPESEQAKLSDQSHPSSRHRPTATTGHTKNSSKITVVQRSSAAERRFRAARQSQPVARRIPRQRS
ncbi:hypothetical protein [Nocardia aurantia]|uniref:Uncharacterized protein n=1 Tax=Nocardia aurantia TaxID=2585199 RepID=A0A7K0DU57_9NOCA|nr:hypothetical protein [Nocardia aurantia]MQY28902.1 hypothetical protein [Nocardia aurantia]